MREITLDFMRKGGLMTTPIQIRLSQMEQDIKEVKEAVQRIEMEHTKMQGVLERYTSLTKQMNDTMNFVLMAIVGKRDDSES